MKNASRGLVTGELPYYLVFGLYMIFAVLQTSFYRNMLPRENAMNAILLACLAVLGLRELFFGIHNRRSLLLLIAAGCFAGNAVLSGTLWTAFPFLLLFFGRDISLKKLFTLAAVLTGLLLLFVICSSYAGLIENYRRIEVNRENNREYLGFLYALFPGFFYFNFAALIIAVRNRRIRFLTLALLFAGAYYLYAKTDGRLAFILTALLLFYAFLSRLLPGLVRGCRFLFFLTIPAFPIAALSSVLLTWRFNASVRWMYRLDMALTHRLDYGLKSLQRFGVRLIGTEVHWVGYSLNGDGTPYTGDYLYVDNMYVNFLQRFGWITFFLAIFLVTAALWRFYKARRYELLFLFFLLTIHGLLDDLILQLAYNTFWIAAVHVLAADQKKEVWDYESIP